ncbi:MAG: threonylcarbamoyl-AMP synthase [Bacteroidetes bacterium GWE2_41_25]|nr:MAG: threonylcarbamoyl-AMP synthase [Bacteroidetes bacterium GWA2_40_15]OFX86605.1 MAG: threonylcarbamoyl-AMP synthase [Bacteroidetes bacterium GWC2_40_22]OFY04369.1 MAG: threonylcarbamoyl-AMP synthase [Bacteroidetes bacterium GWE2_41_25]OFY57980.1 MAG: threonylcarbamoyl-AMP synthase [Bacteroidetes bacterium GWF2_41_9]HAM10339.1 threonylcarbamoyl-AMP synthase [Bacteroidales bacterium]
MLFEEDSQTALKTLRSNGVILYPTDTIWGLGCDATSQDAVEKIFRIKSRDENKSLLILVNSAQMLERYVHDIPEAVFELIAVTDDPLTIIYPKGKNLAKGVCSNDGSVGIRICRDEFCNQLISAFRKPIVSTSANFSGKPSPQLYSEIEKNLIDSVDYVVKYHQNDRQKRSASPVIKFNADGSFKIIRK